MSIVGSDPLAFLTSQGGVVGTPLTEDGASGVDNLDVQQRGAVIGEPVPIVFCRRVSGVGGVLINPPATEARFTDDASSNITASYHLVLSEGQIDSIQVRDVFQGACRVGSYTQTYNRRAGTFVPGNFIDNTPNLRAPTYCGTSGTYAGLSTMAFSVTIPAGFDQWNRQVHCFIRGGIYVPRLLDSVTGPSNNVADLLLYLLRNSSRVPEAMIDTTSLLAAATFTNVNGFWFNGVVSESTNLRDWIGSTLQYFLLRQARIGGKEALKPLVQTNANGTIKTTAVTWAFTFTEEHVIPESFDIIYTPLADRKPFCAVMLWRQQDDLGIPVMRTTEVRYTGTAPDGPFEQHDLSGFCSSENHAVKVGAYILSKRNHVTHRLQLGVKPDAFNPTLAAGDLVRVRLERTPSTGASSLHDYLYEVDRIGKSLTGEVRLDLTHFPVDANKASVVAQEVNAAVGGGLIIGTGASAITCDINSFNDTSVPAESFTSGTFPDYGFSFGGFDESGLGDPPVSNPSNGLDGQEDISAPSLILQPEGALPGLEMSSNQTICPGGTTAWFRDGIQIAGATGATYTPGIDDIGKNITSQVTCPDGSTYTSAPISVATQPEFRYSQPISATVYYTKAQSSFYQIFSGPNCTNPSPPDINSSTTPNLTTSLSNHYRVQPVSILKDIDNNTTGYGGASITSTYTCPVGSVRINTNTAILKMDATGAVTNTVFLGGVNSIANSNTAGSYSSSVFITAIILTENAPGLGVIGDNVWRAGLGWYADVSYLERNYGEVYVNGVLQPFNPYGPPTTP